MNAGRQQCEDEGWQLTCTSNHWSNMETCKQFVECILQPYREQQLKKMDLEEDSKLI
jgi:hypothetical protein